MDGPITLDGRKFIGPPEDIPADQEGYVLGHLRHINAMEIVHGPDAVKHTKEKNAEDLLDLLLISGGTFRILAGLLTEDGRVWNPKDADVNAVRFAAITDVEEKSVMRSYITEFVIDLCFPGARSSEILLQ